MKTLKNNDHNHLSRIHNFLVKLGPTLILPISLVAFSSIILGISISLPLESFVSSFLNDLSSIVFVIFPILVYVSIIIHFHNDKNNNTIINSLITLFIFIAVQSIIVETGIIPSFFIGNLGFYTSYGNESIIHSMTPISFSVFSMMILSFIFIYLDKKISNKNWFLILGFLLVLILTPIFMIISILIWGIGFLISSIPFGFSAFLYGFVNRLLLPFGLHTVLMPTFLYTEIGGVLNIFNASDELVKTIAGDSNIWVFMYSKGMDFTQLNGEIIFEGNKYIYEVSNSYNIGQYQQGFLPILSFGFPITAIVFILWKGWENGKTFLFFTLITALSGISEITEFSFIFISPTLYFFNALIFGLSFWILNILNVSVWISTGWIIDIVMFGIMPSLKGFETNWYWIPIIGILLGLIYSLVYCFVYSKNFKKIT
ncbi:MAG: PTS trehalose transporter subunit IIBC [Candidatus Tyloplasma litorale]|nr:MAG: PTS trehalose transporter subunit IIBC [Mycoplasmatales bacterium]